jgi:hypothetical protein
MSPSPAVHPTEERVFLAACLAHIKRADGSQAKDWCLADTARRGATELLRRYLASPLLSDELTERAYAALEDMRTDAVDEQDWPATQSQAERVLPVVIQLLCVLAST